MILIADGGSTKCDWVVLEETGAVVLKTQTQGLNPSVFEWEILMNRIRENTDLESVRNKISRVDFFGAGCGTKTPADNLRQIIEAYFVRAKARVREDLMAAALAVTTAPGIVCILGTGSNSCYFDGQTTHQKMASLGFILMDEASGNHLGKQLIRDYYYNRMPGDTAANFQNQFDLSPESIKEHLYKKESPNTYLAHFAQFIFTEKTGTRYFESLLSKAVAEMIENKVLCYEESARVPVHFVGSIAFLAQETIRKTLKSYNLQTGNFVKRPIDGVISYYQREVCQ